MTEKSEFHKAAQIMIQGKKESKYLAGLDVQSKIALIKMAEQNWAQRNPIKMLLFGVVLGLIGGYILELLKVYHMLGL